MIHRRIFAKYPGNFEETIIWKKKKSKNIKSKYM